MSDVDQIFSEYIERQLAGERPDALAYLDRLQGPEREELGDLIDAYLLAAPRDPFDGEAFKGSAAERAVESIQRSLRGESGLWPAILPRLRRDAQVKRSELVERLAAALGAAGKEEKVGRYYHDMEHGLLPSAGVSERVLEALGAIVGQSAEALRQAGAALGAGGPAGQSAPVFARTGRPDAAKGPLPEPAAAEAAGAERSAWDEIDTLFRGADD
jgi:hypothetical protein